MRPPQSVRRVASGTMAAVLAALGAACAAEGTGELRLDVKDSAGVALRTAYGAPSSLPVWTLSAEPLAVITGTESGDSAAFSPVGSMTWLPSGAFVIADQGAGRLLVYDSLGAFRRSLGRSGDGPQEFRGLAAFSVMSADTFAIFDGRRRRLSYWHPDAGYLRAVELAGESETGWPQEAWVWDDSSVVVLQMTLTPRDSAPAGAGVRPWRMRAQLQHLDRAGTLLRSGPVFDGMYTGLLERGDARLPFSNTPFAAVRRGRAWFGSGQEFAVAWLDSAFVHAGWLRWPDAQERLGAAEVDSLRAEAARLLERRVTAAEAQDRLAVPFAREILPAYRPAMGRVLVDSEDRLWIERFEPVRLGSRWQTPGSRWTILGRDLRPVARAELPIGVRLEAVRGDRAAVVQRDSLDVESVAIHMIVRDLNR
jgi:hypothetical protein